MKLPSISIGRKHNKVLKEEFSHLSRTTIEQSLKYHNNSDTAKAIRKRALELLQQEIDENRELN